MTFDQLEAMEMIIEKGSFKAAARHLRRTQPTLSVAIKKLESEFGLQIFSRDEYRPKLTQEGQLFYQWAKECMDAFRRLEVVGKELGTQRIEPTLSIVIDPLASFNILSTIFEKCLTQMHPTELTLQTEVLCVGEELLRAGKADFAVALKGDEADDIENIPLERIDMLPVVARSMITRDKILDTTWLKQHPQIIVRSARSDTYTNGSSIGVLNGGKRCFVTDHALKRRLVLEGFGWGRLAHHEVTAELKSGVLHRITDVIAQPFKLDLFIMRSKLRPMGPVARAVWERMREMATKR